MIEKEIESTLSVWISFLSIFTVLALVIGGLSFGIVAIAKADEIRTTFDTLERRICTDENGRVDRQCVSYLRHGK